jgi:hypothetical protein
MRKWSLRILAAFVILLLLLAVAVQVVLWTNLPRNWVLAALQEKLQLRVSAQTFSTGWSGRTELSGVVVSLPLEQEAVLQAANLSIEHTGLLPLIFGRPLRVEGIEIRRPNLLVRQQLSGRWNIEEVAELISRAGGGKTPETQAQPSIVPELPRVTVTDAIVRLIDLRGRQATLAPLTITGAPDGPLVWKYDASIPNQLHFAGKLAPGGAWQHDAQIELSNISPVVAPFLVKPSPATLDALEHFQLAGRWNGRVAENLSGRLDLSKLFLAGYTASGPLGVSFDQDGNGVTSLIPAGLVITPPLPNQLPPGRIERGTIAIDGRSVTTTGLTLAWAAGEVRIAGNYAWDAGEGAAQASWNNLAFPTGANHDGTLTASIHQPWPNQPLIEASLSSQGRFGKDAWTSTLKLDGTGKAWDHINWKLAAPGLVYRHAGQTYNLDNLAATLATRGQLLTLDKLSIPPGALYGKWQRGLLAATGKYDLKSGDWTAYLSGSHWPILPGTNVPADFLVNLSGDRTGARLQQFFLDGDGLQLWADGDLTYAWADKPVELNFYGWYPPLDYTWHEHGDGELESVHLSGGIWSELHMNGRWPAKVDLTGTVYGKNFKIKDALVGDVAIKLSGIADANHVHIDTTRMELLSGIWGIQADLAYDQWLTQIEVSLKDLPLAQLDHFAASPPNLRGLFAGRWNIHLPNFDVSRMTGDGDYNIDNLARWMPPAGAPALAIAQEKPANAGGAMQASHVQSASSGPFTIAPAPGATGKFQPSTVASTLPRQFPLNIPATVATTSPAAPQGGVLVPIAETVTGKIAIADGLVKLDPIRLVRMPRLGSDGITVANISFPIDSPRQMHVEATASAWPLQLFNADTNEVSDLLIWAGTRGIDVDLQQWRATGPVTLHATLAAKDQTINLNIDAQIQQRRLDLKSITGDGLGGHIQGDGYLYLDNPLQSTGRLDWKNVDAQSILALAPWVKGLGGKYSGSVRFAPTDTLTDRDATGPFAVSGKIESSGGNWKGLPIGNATFAAHVDYQRTVLDRLDWNIAGGVLKAWSRVTWYKHDPFLQINLDFDKLSLDEIVKTARPPGQEHKPTPGLLSGRIMAAGNPFSERGRQEASGEAKVRLTESDLANIKVVNLLYSIMSMQLGQQKPTGRGTLEARLEGHRLEIPVMRYFNRGADIWANMAVVDLFKGTSSSIEGTAAGSIRPLRELKLPFMADVDKIVQVLSGSIATVNIQGTVGEPNPVKILFGESGDTFRRFLVGEVKNEVRGTAGQ